MFYDPDRQQSNFHRLEVEERWEDSQIDTATVMAFYMQFGSKYKSKFWEQTRLSACALLENHQLHSLNRAEVYEKLAQIPRHENIRLDYFRRQAEDEYFLRQRMSPDSDEPYKMLGPYQSFVQAAYGLGAPYAHKFPLMSPLIDPPEKHGEIRLDPIMGGQFKKRTKK